jgi:hypothetical protein
MSERYKAQSQLPQHPSPSYWVVVDTKTNETVCDAAESKALMIAKALNSQ